MGKTFNFFALLLISLVSLQLTLGLSDFRNTCPIPSKVSCSLQKCTKDSDCRSGICCPNICSSKSCMAREDESSSGKSSKYGSNNREEYCGGVKCGPREKCDNSRSTSAPKCVRN